MEIKKLRDDQKQKEQEVRNELQTFYNKKMENLEEAVNRQKQANEEANKRALLKINMQQDEINILQREYTILNNEYELFLCSCSFNHNEHLVQCRTICDKYYC